MSIKTKQFHNGMGQAVAERTILRKKSDGSWETWEDVADRVALGNSLLCATQEEQEREYQILKKHLLKANTLMSGRHLQHGDETQPQRPMEVYINCFDGSEKLLTLEQGPVSFKEIVGETVTVKAKDGAWRLAKVKKYGKQVVYKYRFGAKYGSLKNYTIDVLATKNHRWFLADGSITDNLSVGDSLMPAKADNDMDNEAIRHGLIFGDGSAGQTHKRRRDYETIYVSQGRSYCSIRLCGKDKDYLSYFEGFHVSYPPSTNGDPVVYVGKKEFWKSLPFTTDPSYINGFICGWWMADGYKTYLRNANYGGIEISTSNIDCVEWLKSYCAYAGYIITGISVKDRKLNDGSYDNGKPLNCIRLAKGIHRKLLAIEEIGVRDVYCVEEPITTGFVLANGLLTGNCATASNSFMLFLLLMSGCFRKETPVLMADGSLRPIEEVRVGDSVLSFDEEADEFVTKLVLKTYKNAPKPMVKITMEDDTEIFCTEDHKFLTNDGWVQARDLLGKDVKNA